MSQWEKEVDVKIEFKGFEFEANVNVHVVSDSGYGADYDGRRGVKAVFVDDMEILGVWDEKGRLVKRWNGHFEFLIRKAVREQDLSK